jgi:hypothetical protein
MPGAGKAKTDMPEDVEKLAWKYGLSWGARFGDAMHFEVMSPQLREQRLSELVAEGYIKKEDASRIAKGDYSLPLPQSKIAETESKPEPPRPLFARGLTFGMSKAEAAERPAEQLDGRSFAMPFAKDLRLPPNNDATYQEKAPQFESLESPEVPPPVDNQLPIEQASQTAKRTTSDYDDWIGDMHPSPEYNDPTKAHPVVRSDRLSMGKYDNHNVSGD